MSFDGGFPPSSSAVSSSSSCAALAFCGPRPPHRWPHFLSGSVAFHGIPTRPRFFGKFCHSSAARACHGPDDATTSHAKPNRIRDDPAPDLGPDNAARSGSLRPDKGFNRSERFNSGPASDVRTQPLPGKHFQGAYEINTGFRPSSDHGSATGFRREFPASIAYEKPRSFVREYPARVDRLQAVVSRNCGNLQSHGKSFLSEVEASQKASLREIIPSNREPFQSHSSEPLSVGHERGIKVPVVSPFRNAKVSVFWDLDNKPPTIPPYEAALFLRHAASQFGSVADMVAYANYHAFTHVPEWVREQRRDRKELDLLERSGIVQPEKPYVCELCGRRCKTNVLLKKHFKELHVREHNKRMTRLNSLKGKKREKYRAAVMPKTQRFKEVASPILVPRVGYGLESDLRRAGVFVKTVQYRPQAADIELKKQVANSIQKGVKCICLVSDDAGFSTMLADARALNLCTIVFGDSKSLKRYADFWFPWEEVLRGMPAEAFQEAIYNWTMYHTAARQRDLQMLERLQEDDSEVDHKVFGGNPALQKSGISAFSDEEPMLQHVGYVSESDGREWSLDDEDDEEWELEDDDNDENKFI